MPSDIRRSLEDASAAPANPVDVATLWRKARQRTIMARAVVSAAVIVGIAAPGAIYLSMTKDPGGPILPAESPSASSDRDGTEAKLCDGVPFDPVAADACVPYDPSFARYAVSVPAEGPEIADKGEEKTRAGVVNGILELSPQDRSACLTLTGLSFTEASITDGEPVATFVLADAVAGNICVDTPARDLGLVNGDPNAFILEVELSDGDVVGAPLEYLDQSGSDGNGSHGALTSDYEFEPFPGSEWYEHGNEEPVGSRVINAIKGPGHCDWQSAVLMHVGWPLGHEAADSSESRQFLRDPESVLPKGSAVASFDPDADLPRRARFTGYQTDFMELWLDPIDEDVAYLRFADHIERWPRATEVIGCR